MRKVLILDRILTLIHVLAIATAQTWAFNALLAITFPPLLSALNPQGAFGLYAGFCGVVWVWKIFVDVLIITRRLYSYISTAY